VTEAGEGASVAIVRRAVLGTIAENHAVPGARARVNAAKKPGLSNCRSAPMNAAGVRPEPRKSVTKPPLWPSD
jgi:hypothetical protein